MNIALLSPSGDAYSETFIQLHKKLLNGNIRYYYGGFIPSKLEGKPDLVSSTLFNRTCFSLLNKIRPSALVKIRLNALRRSFLKEKIDLVFCEFGPTGAEVLEVCRELKLPLIVHFHGYDATMKEVLIAYKERYLNMFDFASVIVAVSMVMQQKLRDIGAPRDKLIVNTYGPNSEYFDISACCDTSQFVSIGRFVDKKAPQLTIQAFKLVLARYPYARLIMCGNGPLLPDCKKLVSDLGIQNAVEFSGIANRDAIKRLFKHALAYVQHSVTAANGDMEGTPVVILEACAAGLPVVSTYHAGIPDVVIHGETGLLVEEHDFEGMAANMMKLLEDTAFARTLGNKGKERIKNHFTIERHIQILNEVIENSATR